MRLSAALASPRRRRRLAWVSGALVLAGGVSAGAYFVGNTGQSIATPTSATPPLVYHAPQPTRLTEADRQQLMKIVTEFLTTAVRRQNLDESWALLGPDMRAGQTRASWDSGNNTVVPFAAIGIAAWQIDYAYRNDVGIDVAVLGKPSSGWRIKTFTIELKQYPFAPHRWLVAAWVPKGIGGYRTSVPPSEAAAPVTSTGRRLPLFFALAPIGLVGIGVVALGCAGVWHSLRGRRKARRLAAALGQTSSSRPS